MANGRRKVSLDLDDFLVHFDVPYTSWLEEDKGYTLGERVNNHFRFPLRYPDSIGVETHIHEFVTGPGIERMTLTDGAIEALGKLAVVFENHIVTARPETQREATVELVHRLGIDNLIESIHHATRPGEHPAYTEKGYYVTEVLGALAHGDDTNKNANSVQEFGAQAYLLETAGHFWNGRVNIHAEELHSDVIIVNSLGEFATQVLKNHGPI